MCAAELFGLIRKSKIYINIFKGLLGDDAPILCSVHRGVILTSFYYKEETSVVHSSMTPSFLPSFLITNGAPYKGNLTKFTSYQTGSCSSSPNPKSLITFTHKVPDSQFK